MNEKGVTRIIHFEQKYEAMKVDGIWNKWKLSSATWTSKGLYKARLKK